MLHNLTQEILEIFYQLTTIPHSSKNTSEMLSFIQSYAQMCGYEVKIDEVGNLLAYQKSATPTICYQSHYDMVCVGVAAQNLPLNLIQSKRIDEYGEQTWLKAEDSSLGADNGMGMAIMMYFMKQKINAEFLFTNDEEIGMIGAKGLNIPIQSKILINLDSEVLGEITISCAGGFDLSYKSKFETRQVLPNWHYYILQSHNFAGGHSGLDINNPAPSYQNAILESAKFLYEKTQRQDKPLSITAINWQGGEKRNSIPINSKLIFASETKLQPCKTEYFELIELKDFNNGLLDRTNETFLQTPQGIDFTILYNHLMSIPIGVLESQNNLVLNSLSLSHICFANGALFLAFMGRANAKTLLDSNLNTLKSKLLQDIPMRSKESVEISISDYYDPWEKCENMQSQDGKAKHLHSFENALQTMQESMQIYTKDLGITCKIVELHAGLECGILLTRFKELGLNDIVALSIGPTINSPHSIKESVWIESAGIIVAILQNFMTKINGNING